MIGLFLIVMGLVQIFQALSKYAQPGRMSNSLFVFVTALMFTLGATLIWWDGKWWNDDSSKHE